MRLRSDIHTFEDEQLAARIVRTSRIVLGVGTVAVVAAAAAMARYAPNVLDRQLSDIADGISPVLVAGVLWLGWIVVAVALSLAAHELVHGIFFRALAPRGAHVTFGVNWQRAMLYACAEGVVYTRRQYLVIALAPTFVVTVLLIGAGCVCLCPVAGLVAAVLHLSGCTGDWEYVHRILADPLITHCEDTSFGVRFYGDDETASDTMPSDDGSNNERDV